MHRLTTAKTEDSKPDGFVCTAHVILSFNQKSSIFDVVYLSLFVGGTLKLKWV